MKKKFLPALLCSAALACSLAACGETANASGGETAQSIAFAFTDSGITASGSRTDGYEIDGTALTITDAGTYTLSGTCADGSVTVKKGTEGVTLVLNGLSLTSADTAPISCNKSTEVTILATDGTTNTLTDAAENNDDAYPDNENAENAVLKCKDGSTVTLGGTGTLNIVANGKNGIKSGATTEEEGEASLTIRDLTLNISAPVNDAVNAEQLLNIESGTITVSAADDALHCDLVMNVGADGTDGPAINITECYEGLEAAELNIFSGDIDINASDDCMNAANSSLSGYDFSMTISGGTINAYSSSGDGFDSNGDLTITGGAVAVWTANRADNQPLDADGTLTITGGTVIAAGGSSGMGVSISAEQLFATFGSSSMGGFGGGFPGTPGERPDAAQSTDTAAQSGAPAVPDMTQKPEKPADGELPDGAAFGDMSGTASIAKGEAFTIRDASGNVVYSGTALCDTNYVFFSSSDLTDGGSYTLSTDSADVETASAQTGTVSSGFAGGMGGQRPGGDGSDRKPPEKPDGEAPDFGSGQMPPDRPSSSGDGAGSGAPAEAAAQKS